MIWDPSEYAFSTWTLDRKPLKEALALIKDNGFDDVEIWANAVHLDPALNPDIHQVRQWVRGNGQTVHSIHSPFTFPEVMALPEKAFRETRMERWKKTLDYCGELESPMMVIHGVGLGYHYGPDQTHLIRDCLQELCALGALRGVSVALENIASGKEPGELKCTLENQSALFAGFGLKYCLDIGHVALNGGVMEREIDCAVHDLITFHVSNNDGVHDLHSLPDEGELSWAQIHDYARNAGYQGKFVLELCGGPDQEATLRRAAALFSR